MDLDLLTNIITFFNETEHTIKTIEKNKDIYKTQCKHRSCKHRCNMSKCIICNPKCKCIHGVLKYSCKKGCLCIHKRIKLKCDICNKIK